MLSISTAVYKTLKNSSKSWICCQCGFPNFDSSFFDSSIETSTTNSFKLLNTSVPSLDTSISVINSPTSSSTPKATSSKRQCKNISLKAIVLNAQSIKCEDHNNELQCIISEQKPDIIAITETWLKPDIPNSDIIPDYFSVYRKDRPGVERGGGVLIAVNNNLLSSVCTELDTECEILWVKIELTTAKDFHFGVFYRPPTTKHNLDELQRSIEKLGIKIP